MLEIYRFPIKKIMILLPNKTMLSLGYDAKRIENGMKRKV